MNKQKPLFHVLCLALLLPLLALSPVQGADSTSFDPTKVAVKAKGAGGVPVGTIIAWPVSRNPEDMDKWLECYGQSVSSAVYPELYAVVGGSVPDFRGLFLRGIGGNSASLGTYQGDEMRKHKHGITLGHEGGGAASDTSGFPNTDASGPFAYHSETQPDGSWANNSGAGNPIHSFGGDENRSVHRAVFVCGGDNAGSIKTYCYKHIIP